MSEPRVLAVFCYDISRASARTRVAELLGADATRVQESVFEGWMSEKRARAIAAKAMKILGDDDSLRLYVLNPRMAMRTLTIGPGAPVEADEFHLF